MSGTHAIFAGIVSLAIGAGWLLTLRAKPTENETDSKHGGSI
jgi:hypothetical protein